jgi:hypothetical protein
MTARNAGPGGASAGRGPLAPTTRTTRPKRATIRAGSSRRTDLDQPPGRDRADPVARPRAGDISLLEAEFGLRRVAGRRYERGWLAAPTRRPATTRRGATSDSSWAACALLPASLNAGADPAPLRDPPAAGAPPPTPLATRVRAGRRGRLLLRPAMVHPGRSPLRPAIVRHRRSRGRGGERARDGIGQLRRGRGEPRPGHDHGHDRDGTDHARDVAPAHTSEQVGPHGFP